MADEEVTIESIAQLISGETLEPEEHDTKEVEETEEVEAADDAEAEGEDEPEIEDAPTWGKALGLDDETVAVDDDGNLTGIVVKIDGKVSTVEVKELIAGYQLNKHVTQKSQALAEERKVFEQQRAQIATVFKEKLANAEKLNDYLTQALTAEFDNLDWNMLRTTNPGEYAARMEDYRSRKNQLEVIKAAVDGEKEELTAEQKRDQQAWLQNYLNEQKSILVAKNPDWVDDAKFNSALARLGETAGAEYGITPQEFYELTDARYIEILKDAIAFRSGKQAVAKKVMNVPKFQKPSTSKPTSKRSADKELQLIKQARNSHRVDDKVAAATAILDNAFGN